MLSLKKTLVSCFLIASLVVSSLPALAETSQMYPDKEKKTQEGMAIDLLAVRPLGVVATLAGSVVFLVSWPFSALGGNTDEAWTTLVAEPAVYTFQRPLGDFEE
ncbi:MAG: hypothetical protein GY799_31895 [Desulfobulbaceae bacterium]|nr:hypothetical protein [Desulfobulbaceae bacterium]